MYNQVTVRIKCTDRNVFIKTKPSTKTKTSTIHYHHYTEIHFVANGTLGFSINGEEHSLQAGDIFTIPQKLLHSCTYVSDDCRCLSIFIDWDIEHPILIKSSCQMITDFFDSVQICEEDFSKPCAYISLLCNDLFTGETVSTKELQDYGLIIEDFFSVNYANNVKLSDLANILHLSQKQTERLIIKYTGKTFKQKISHQRIKIAKLLISKGQMSMQEIAEYVGYNSYSGFWKALKQYDDISI